ncbi:DUF262 domain-containing protein [Flavobacterium sp. F-65]|uniref:DUF262 domain-containing protein n=1 Tax=Flavobacterium pisciphilum TaxID=2893755 RepID=A0ABS8MR69_9FLAO|nr:DUF262 domain-containing protein [Flavobacterium sp. F-65]MCC9071258.1 DUF262 domain-containing protein [Flavobacterium sp. F-65]
MDNIQEVVKNTNPKIINPEKSNPAKGIDQINNLYTRPIKDLEGYNFFIDEYQRGYKWTSQQVLDLLNDIKYFNPKNEVFYCLQPLAVKLLSEDKIKEHFNSNYEKSFEVIDGQQRLTTIHIILKTISSSIYNIKYQTRDESARFLNIITNELEQYSIEFSNDAKKNDASIKFQWGNFIENQNKFKNIDVYHFFGAYLVIKAWFYSIGEVDVFLKNLLNHTHFIWYEDKRHENSKSVFRNLNSGKIELTNAELIKALFINNLKHENIEIQQLQQTSLASEWDTIEQTLQDDVFWFFINNEKDKTKYETRIDFLFELIVGTNSKNDKLYAYHQYSEGKHQLIWSEIKNLFLKLREWFNDQEKYHLIGFIVDRKIKSLKHIIKVSENVTKDIFLEKLITMIKEDLKESNVHFNDLKNLSYNSYGDTLKILLLFNIETYQKSEAQFRFPFNKFKNEKWTLEHIHAQNADDFENIAELKIFENELRSWNTEIKKHIEYLRKKENQSKIEIEELNGLSIHFENFKVETIPLIEKLKVSWNDLKNEDEINNVQRDYLNEIIESIEDIMGVHKLSNMALLDGNTNSGLGKKRFIEKRKYIIKTDKVHWQESDNEKHFIPICTKNVFLKYYTKNITQMDIWGYLDRENYIESISLTLKKYFIITQNTNEQ